MRSEVFCNYKKWYFLTIIKFLTSAQQCTYAAAFAFNVYLLYIVLKMQYGYSFILSFDISEEKKKEGGDFFKLI